MWEHRFCNEPPGSAVAQPAVARPGRGYPPWSSVASSVKWGNRVTISQDCLCAMDMEPCTQDQGNLTDAVYSNSTCDTDFVTVP